MLGSPPPWRAAMMMARLSLLHSLPRLASMAAFLCLIVAQWEWPDMVSPRDARPKWSTDLLQHIQFTRHLVEPAIFLGDRLQAVELLRLAPGLAGLAQLAEAVVDIAEVVPKGRLVAAVALGHGSLENRSGLGKLPLAEEDPGEAVEIRRPVFVVGGGRVLVVA